MLKFGSCYNEELATTLGSNISSYRRVTGWVSCFRERRENVNDDARPLSGEKIELLQQVISNDLHSTYRAEISLSHGTIERIIHDCLKLKKLTSRWIPHQLSDETLSCKSRDGSWGLCDIITGEETWIYYRQIGYKSTNANTHMKLPRQIYNMITLILIVLFFV